MQGSNLSMLRLRSAQAMPAAKYSKSFTLIELLIVIAIIGVLAVTVVMALNPGEAQKKARDAKRKLDLGVIKNAMEQYYSLCNGSYPGAVDGKVPGTIETIAPACSSETVIMSAAPLDPKAGVSYDYDDAVIPPDIAPKICASDVAEGVTNLMETESSAYCVYLEQ